MPGSYKRSDRQEKAFGKVSLLLQLDTLGILSVPAGENIKD
jgi:hypothetical protein